MKRKSRPALTLTAAGGESVEVFLDAIMYFEQKNHIVELHTAEGVLRTSQSARLGELEARLPSPPFVRCHRSYLVNLDYVQSADREQNAFFLMNGDRADIRQGGFGKCKALLQEWRMEKSGRDEV
jgi:DNA-binding LytR/AlgR family response regulator